MTTSELRSIFENNKVPDYFYEFDGLGAGDCFCIERSIQGWDVFYSDRGRKFSVKTFADEDSACDELFRRVDQRYEREFGKPLSV